MKFSWSWSALNSYEACPRRFYETRVAKNFQEVHGPQLLWGNEVHKACEKRLFNPDYRMPDGMESYGPIVDQIRAAPGDTVGEGRLALDENYQPCDWRSAHLRGIIDVGKKLPRAMFMGDYKTGKKDPNSDQLKLSALMGFHTWPDVERITTAFIWLQFRDMTPATFHREDIPSMWNKLLPRVERMKESFATNRWEARPSGLCKKHCPVTTCPHNGSYGK